jgi:uncharacterized membrane protein (DUF106 family)
MTKETIQTIVIDQKRLKEFSKQMKTAAKELSRLAKGPPLSPAESRELRAEQQRQRRANKALLSVVL